MQFAREFLAKINPECPYYRRFQAKFAAWPCFILHIC